jgi:hypothetical protein
VRAGSIPSPSWMCSSLSVSMYTSPPPYLFGVVREVRQALQHRRELICVERGDLGAHADDKLLEPDLVRGGPPRGDGPDGVGKGLALMGGVGGLGWSEE